MYGENAVNQTNSEHSQSGGYELAGTPRDSSRGGRLRMDDGDSVSMLMSCYISCVRSSRSSQSPMTTSANSVRVSTVRRLRTAECAPTSAPSSSSDVLPSRHSSNSSLPQQLRVSSLVCARGGRAGAASSLLSSRHRLSSIDLHHLRCPCRVPVVFVRPPTSLRVYCVLPLLGAVSGGGERACIDLCILLLSCVFLLFRCSLSFSTPVFGVWRLLCRYGAVRGWSSRVGWSVVVLRLRPQPSLRGGADLTSSIVEYIQSINSAHLSSASASPAAKRQWQQRMRILYFMLHTYTSTY